MEHVPHTIIFLLVDYSEAATPSMLLNKSCRRNLLPTVGTVARVQNRRNSLYYVEVSRISKLIGKIFHATRAKGREGQSFVSRSLSPRARALCVRTYVALAYSSLARLSSEEGYGMIESVSRGIRFIRQSY
jgi:hypothetical protein